MGKVFISYSHDSPEHSQRVLGLALALRSNGVDIELDQFHNEEIIDWPRWCNEQISSEHSEFVLCVCTAEYRRRIEGNVPPEKGKGVYWEGSLLDDDIYDAKGNRRLLPLLFDTEPDSNIPRFLRGWTYCRPRDFVLHDAGYEHLLRILTGQARVMKNDLGPVPVLPTQTPSSATLPSAPRTPQTAPVPKSSAAPGKKPPAAPGPAQALQKFATPALRRARSQRPKQAKFRVIAFDLDGTLLRGLDFSWTLVWQHLKVPENVWKGQMRNYLTSKRTFQDYQEWCDSACRQFRTAGLKRDHFRTIVSSIRLTVNLKQAIQLLRNEGFIVAIISGGIDSFLQEMIPDAPELFDYICINQLHFDDQGLVSGVDATPFDFAGKATGLETICKAHGVTMEQSVFVGEGFNDEAIAGRAGLTIAYPPKADGFKWAAGVQVEADDLIEVVNHVL